MKNYIIGTLIVAILVMSSFMYKNSRSSGRTSFPIDEETKIRASNIEIPLYIYIFFSKHNCHDCLEVIEILNDLPPQFIVTGVVPDHELQEKKEIRVITGAVFPLIKLSQYSKNYQPWYAPTMIGVSPNGKIIFTMPGVPGEKEYLKNFLESLYAKTYPIFMEQRTK